MESALDMYWFHNDTPTVWTQILRDIDQKYKLDIELELTEPAFFLPEATGNRPVVLRGRCTLIVKRPLKIKEVVVALDGFSYVRWRPSRIRDMGSVVNCALTLFNSKKDSKAQFQFQAKEPKKPTTSVTEVEVPQKFKTLRRVVDKLHPRSQRTEPDVDSKCFSPGKYSYDFEMILHSGLPESTFVEGAIVRYQLKGSVKCHNRLRGMYKSTEIEVVRCPADAYVEDSVGGHWSLLVSGVVDIEITLPRKGIALEDCLPILFQFKGYNNTKFQKLDVYLVEDIRYYSRNGANAGRAPSKKIFLYKTPTYDLRPDAHGEQEVEKSPEEDFDIFEAKPTSFPTSSGICNTPDGENEGAPVRQTFDLHMNLPMPKCKSHRGAPDFRYMHSDTKLSSLEVRHSLEFQIWIYINNKPTPEDFVRRVPLTLRSCYAHPGNAVLPPYSEEPLPVYSSPLDAPVSTTDHER